MVHGRVPLHGIVDVGSVLLPWDTLESVSGSPLSDPSDVEIVMQHVGALSVLGPPFHDSIGGKDPIPHVQRDAEVAASHVVAMVEVVDRQRHPENETWVFVLQLVSVAREGGECHNTGGEAQPCRYREQEAEPDDGQSGHDIIGELASPTLTGKVSVVLCVAFREKFPGVHHAVHPVFDKRAKECRKKPEKKDYDERQRTLQMPFRERARAV